MSEIVRLRDYPQYGITRDGRVFSYKSNMRVIAEDDHGHEVYRFRSQSEARQYGFDQRLISRAIKHGYRHKGLYWREVVLYEDNS